MVKACLQGTCHHLLCHASAWHRMQRWFTLQVHQHLSKDVMHATVDLCIGCAGLGPEMH